MIATARASLLLLAAVLTAACSPQDPGGPATGSSGAMTGGTGDASDPTTSGGDASSSSSSGDAPVCEVSPDEGACAICSNMNCCAEIRACQAEPACDCMTSCVTGLDDIAMCTTKCGTSTNFSPLTMCTILHCAADCT